MVPISKMRLPNRQGLCAGNSLLEELERSLLGLGDLGLDVVRLDVRTLSLGLDVELAELSDEALDLLGLLGVDLLLELVEGLLRLGGDRVGRVGSLDEVAAGLVGLGVSLGLGNHRLDLLVRETRRGSNGDRLVLVGGLVLGRDVDDTVGVNVERDLDLGDTLGRGRDSDELEVAEHLVVADKLTLALEHLDLDGGLAVSGSREGLRLLGRDGRVAVDQASEDTAEGLSRERRRQSTRATHE
jgi:hypothetical protein